jgi:hypothetical protein
MTDGLCTQIENPVSLERLGMNQEYLASVTEGFDENEDELEYSRVEEEMRDYDEWLRRYELGCKYAREEMEQSRERFRRLPKPSAKGLGTLVRLAENAYTLDHARRRRGTWSKERAGGNLYRE